MLPSPQNSPSPPSLRSVVLTDSLDPLLFERLAQSGVLVVATTADPTIAASLVAAQRPEVAVIVVGSSPSTAFAAARELGRFTSIVLVSDAPEHALEAFAVGADGFVLGASDLSGLERATERVRRTTARTTAVAADRITLRDGARTLILRPDTIDWIEAAGNYARLHADGGHRLVRTTLATIETKLDPNRFVRIHRSSIVNVDRVAVLEPAGRDLVALLRDGRRLGVSRSFRQRLTEVLGVR